MKNAVIAVLAILVVWLSLQIIRLERYHYASFLSMCMEQDQSDPVATVKRDRCLNNTETRTSSLAHLWYGVVDRY
jgi:hypothetical protein